VWKERGDRCNRTIIKHREGVTHSNITLPNRMTKTSCIYVPWISLYRYSSINLTDLFIGKSLVHCPTLEPSFSDSEQSV